MTPDHFSRFLDVISDYLYSHGWYSQACYVRDKKTCQEVLDYLTNHCYSRSESEDIVAKYQLMTAQCFPTEETGSD